MDKINSFLSWLFTTEQGHFALYYIFANAVGTMPAPTATSGIAYSWAFKFLNAMGANFSRAKSTAVEQSPNFVPAVNAQMAKNGSEKVVVPVGPDNKGVI